MTEYLSKEEIKQWRSSLEKITLEEFASRLGKCVEPPKSTHDIADIVLKGKPVTDMDRSYALRAEKLSIIAQRAFEREQEISVTPFSVKNINKEFDAEVEKDVKSKKKKSASKSEEIKSHKETKKAKDTKTVKKSETAKVKTAVSVEKTVSSEKQKTLRDEVHIVFKKVLTDREQKVFDYFFKNAGKIVYAKDLATLLDLPKDYVYKYIKNIRSKMENGELQNAEMGGFLLKK